MNKVNWWYQYFCTATAPWDARTQTNFWLGKVLPILKCQKLILKWTNSCRSVLTLSNTLCLTIILDSLQMFICIIKTNQNLSVCFVKSMFKLACSNYKTQCSRILVKNTIRSKKQNLFGTSSRRVWMCITQLLETYFMSLLVYMNQAHWFDFLTLLQWKVYHHYILNCLVFVAFTKLGCIKLLFEVVCCL